MNDLKKKIYMGQYFRTPGMKMFLLMHYNDSNYIIVLNRYFLGTLCLLIPYIDSVGV